MIKRLTLVLLLSAIITTASANQDVDVIIEDAKLNELSGDYYTAIKLYEEALQITENYELHLNIGKAFHQVDSYSDALLHLNKAVIYKETAEVYTALGHVRSDMGQDFAAINNFTAALEFNPNDVSAYIHRSFSFANIGFYDEAVRDLAIAIQIDEEETIAYYNMASAMGININTQACSLVQGEDNAMKMLVRNHLCNS